MICIQQKNRQKIYRLKSDPIKLLNDIKSIKDYTE